MKNLVKGLAILSVGTIMLTTAASAELMTTVPSSSVTVTDWYKQPVYDKNNAKIGDIKDVLLASNGDVSAVMLAVGGFLGAGEKDVAVSFDSIKKTTKDNKAYLTLDTTKDALKSAPGFKYDSDKTTWVPDKR